MEIRYLSSEDDLFEISGIYEKNGFTYSGECRIDMIGGKELRELLYVYK